MTLAELKALVFEKTYDDNPLRPSDELQATSDSEEFLEQYQAQHDYYMLCMDAIEEDDRVWWREIMWFWYHHAISCAIWKRKDRKLAQQYANKAREIQGELSHPNRITELLRLLVHDEVGRAHGLVNQLMTEANSAKELLQEYERGEFFK